MALRRGKSPADYQRAGETNRRRTYAIWHARLIDKPPFGKLTVIGLRSRLRRDGYSREWVAQVRCECGVETEIEANSIFRGHATSCGCNLRRVKSECPSWRGTKDISATFFKRAKKNAETRGLAFELTPELLQEKWESQQGKCFYTGWSLNWGDAEESQPSLDRLDSSLGYTPDNVVFTSWLVNRLKNDVPAEDFVRVCAAVSGGCSLL